jgi:hypothetical protein
MSINRRSFLKTGIAGAVGASLAGPGVKQVLGKTSQQSLVWTDKMPINPEVDNMRVICMHDEGMAGTYGKEDYAGMNAAVDEEKVWYNMDGMARYLTQKTDTDEAWHTIFRSSKDWADTKVMIKHNCVAANMISRSAVVRKITSVLIGFGVQPANIVHFDGQGGNWQAFAAEVSLTDETKIPGVFSDNYDALGGQSDVTVPNVNGGYAPADLVNGVTDIIVNIAVNKGHNSNFNVGKTTLCLKNHYGTFLSGDGFGGFNKRTMYGGGLTAMHLHNAQNALTNINKTFSIVGGDPVRQQLCIIDTLWAITGNVTGAVSHKPDRLIMGTFAGAVDYCCAKKVREELMNVKNHEQENLKKFLTEFGYTEEDPEWIEVTPEMVKMERVNPGRNAQIFNFSITPTSMKRVLVNFAVKDVKNLQKIQIFNLAGKLIKQIDLSGSSKASWDGRSSGGDPVSAGSYMVRLSAGRKIYSNRIMLA